MIPSKLWNKTSLQEVPPKKKDIIGLLLYVCAPFLILKRGNCTYRVAQLPTFFSDYMQ